MGPDTPRRPSDPARPRRTSALGHSSQRFADWVDMQHALADIAELCELPRDADPGAIVEAVRATRERDWEARQAMLGRTSRID